MWGWFRKFGSSAAKDTVTVDTDLEPHEGQIEMASALIPGYGPEVVVIEQLAFTVLKVVATLIKDHGSVTETAKTNPGLSTQLLTSVQELMQQYPQILQPVSLQTKTK